jgi:uncharacterized YigZ family protein
MASEDTYTTIKSVSQGAYKEKGSRFIAFAIPVSSIEEIKVLLADYRKKYHDARHHCYAYLLGFEKNLFRANDDGEPSGTAGKPILGQINSFGLTNVLIIVIRYFGGTLLGTGGLINAYKTAAYESLKNSDIIECTLQDHYKLEFPWSAMNDVMRIMKEEHIGQTSQIYGLNCSVIIHFRISLREKIIKKLSLVEGVVLTFNGTS